MKTQLCLLAALAVSLSSFGILHAATERPSVVALAGGLKIPVQREWVDEADAEAMKVIPMDQRPRRFNQRAPVHVATEERAGQNPVYYFRDVRWKQEKSMATGRHRAYYTTVRVDMEKVKGAWVCLKPFAPKWLAGHAAILLEMHAGGFTNLDGEDGGGFVMSFEAWMRAAQSYSLIKGQMGKFPIIYVVGTWQDFLYKSIAMDDSVVQRWKLALSEPELQALEVAIGKAVIADHREERYNTLTHSCVTAALLLVNQAVPEARRMAQKTFFGLLPNLGFSLPVLTDRALKRKGLIDGDMQEIQEINPESFPATPTSASRSPPAR